MQLSDELLSVLSRIATTRGVSSNELVGEMIYGWAQREQHAAAGNVAYDEYAALRHAARRMRGRAAAAPQAEVAEHTVDEVMRAAGTGIFDGAPDAPLDVGALRHIRDRRATRSKRARGARLDQLLERQIEQLDEIILYLSAARAAYYRRFPPGDE